MKKCFLIISMVLFFVSCEQKEEEVQTVKINEQYSVELPAFLSEGDSLNADASLQYQNVFKEFYVVVIDEPKVDLDSLFADTGNNLENYAKLLKTNFQNGLTKIKISPTTTTQINGLKAQTLTIEGVLEGTHNIYYEAAVVESKTHYYQVLAWTLANQKEKYSKQMKNIIASFKELKSRGLKKRLPK